MQKLSFRASEITQTSDANPTEFPSCHQAYTISERGNIFPCRLFLCPELFELKIEKFDCSQLTSPVSPLSPSSPSSPQSSYDISRRRVSAVWQKFRFSISTGSSQSSTTSYCSPVLSEEVISLDEINEVRLLDYNSKLVPSNSKAITELLRSSIHDSGCKIMEIFYGNEFKLKCRKFVIAVVHYDKSQNESEETNVLEKWVNDLRTLVKNCKSMTYFQRLDLWYKKQFDEIIGNNIRTNRHKVWKQFLAGLHHHSITKECIQSAYEYLQENLRDDDPYFGIGSIERSEFNLVARYFLHSTKSVSTVFDRLFKCGNYTWLELLETASDEELQVHPMLKWYYILFKHYFDYLEDSREECLSFCTKNYVAPQNVHTVIRKFADKRYRSNAGTRLQNESWLCSYFLLDYLFSNDNSIWSPDATIVYQDMTKPFSHYWISSSHNSYLTGDQYMSESSTESYARILRQGCRCIEVDVWNGPLNKPIVTHGRTLTTNVKLKDVLLTIKNHAFATSPYPVIISIENHCNARQQKKMAKYFRNIFGKMLVTSQLEDALVADDISQLPSPEQLKYKIILKGRKSSNTSDEPTVVENRDSNIEASPCDCLLTGDLRKLDENGMWRNHIFVLTNKKLFYFENKETKEDIFEASVANFIEHSKSPNKCVDQSPETEDNSDNDQLWFHGKMDEDGVSGRDAAAAVLQMHAMNGSFLVRESDSRSGYTLSFYYRHQKISISDSWPAVHHCIIYEHAAKDTGKKIFSIWKRPRDGEMFESIFQLVKYYMHNPLVTTVCRLACLGNPVPPLAAHERQEWFYANMDRMDAERVLAKLPINGAFLARYGTDDKRKIVISLRIDSVIKHCCIRREGSYLTVSNLRFVKLENLVEHYSKHPFYRDVKLEYPVGKILYSLSQRNDGIQRVYASKEYVNSTVKTVKGRFRAIQSHKVSDTDLLWFRRGDIIVNVTKFSTGWWSGTRQGAVGGDAQIAKEFPDCFVEEIEEVEGFGQSLENGEEWKLGTNTKLKLNKDAQTISLGIKYYLSFDYCENESKLKLGASCSKRKAMEWVDMINWARLNDSVAKTLVKSVPIERKHVTSELSQLLVYCCNMDHKICPTDILWEKSRVNTCLTKSLDEISGDKLFRSHPQFFVWYHQHALTRIYPRGLRLDSSNYNPVRFWNFGSQLVALNFQTPDKAMQWNRGKFMQNGNCGYVLKPDIMMPKNKYNVKFDPTRRAEDWSGRTTQLIIQIISARHLKKPTLGQMYPMVEIEVIGVDVDRIKLKTSTEETGLNPHWNQTFQLKLHCPELALVQFSVYDVDTFGDTHLLGESTIPFPCIRHGYRSIQLQNAYGAHLMSSILIFSELQVSPELHVTK